MNPDPVDPTPAEREVESRETVVEGARRAGGRGDRPARIGPYELTGELGRGGMGVVHRAIDPRLGREVAIKVLPDLGAAGEDTVRRFEREARAMAALDHPHVVRVHDAGRDGGVVFLVMEVLPGPSLDAFVGPDRERLPVAGALRRVAEAARGLAAAHAAGILHRDLKPANLILGADGRTRLADFGLARVDEPGRTALTGSEAFMGTPCYMSPEQAEDASRVDERSDVYSLGATLYALLSGRPPFEADTIYRLIVLVIERDPPPLSRLVPGIPRDVEAIVGRAMEKEPERRYAGAAAFADDVDRFLEGRVVLARRPGRLDRGRRWLWRRRRSAVPIAAAVVVALGLVSYRTGSAALAGRRLEDADRRAAALVRERTASALGAIEAERAAVPDPDDVLREVDAIYEAAGLAPAERRARTRERLAAFPDRLVRSARAYSTALDRSAGGDADGAVDALREVDDPGYVDAARALELDVLIRADRLEEALARAVSFSDPGPCSARNLFDKAWLERRLGLFEDHAATAERLARRTDLSAADRWLVERMERWAREWTGPRVVRGAGELDLLGGSFEIRVDGPESRAVLVSLDPPAGGPGGIRLVLRAGDGQVALESTGPAGSFEERLDARTAGRVRAHLRYLAGPGTLDLAAVDLETGRTLARAYRTRCGRIYPGRYRLEATGEDARIELHDTLEGH